MALTISVVKRNVTGGQRSVIADVTFDSSYPTGGEAFSPSDVGGDAGDVFHFLGVHMNDATAADQRHVIYDYANKKLMVFTALTTEALNASDQSAVKIRVHGLYGQVS